MRVVVFGGSGFIGSHVVEEFLRNGDTVRCIDLKRSVRHPEITMIGDVRDKDSVSSCMDEADVVLMLAGLKRPDVEPVQDYYDTHVGGLQNVLQRMEEIGCKRIVMVSSVAVYGMNRPDYANVKALKQPIMHYGKSLWTAEQALQEWYLSHQDWNINIVRLTSVYGEGSKGSLYSLIHLINNDKFMMVGKGRNMRSISYVGNVAAMIRHMVEHVREGFNAYTYADEPSLTMAELANKLCSLIGKPMPKRIPLWIGVYGGKVCDWLAKHTGKRYAVSESRIKKFCSTMLYDGSMVRETGFVQPYTLDEGLKRTIEHELKR